MKPTITLVRAVGTEFARRAIRPFIVAGLVAALLLHVLGGWLTTVNIWWWLLETLFIGLTLLLVVMLVAVTIVLRAVGPRLTAEQKPAVSRFVDKLLRVAENIKTPYVVIIFYVVRDIIWPRKGSFIETISEDSKTLAPDLAKLRKLFS